MREAIRNTTILCIRHNGRVVMAGDGQVSMGETIMKARARKVRTLHEGNVLVGFSGATADALTLFEKLEAKLKEFGGNLTRATVELAKEWRTDRILRRLEALLLSADRRCIYLISGTGDVIEPDRGVMSIGSGGQYALAAARALMEHTNMNAREIAEAAMKIAAEICVFTNPNLVIEELK